MRRRLRPEDYTIGWVCALAIELVAAQEMLDEEHETPSNNGYNTNVYTCGRVGKHNVVIACLPEGQMGTNSAAMVANQMEIAFTSVRFGLMVGIGGGVPSEDVDIRLGDVVVSKPYNDHGGVVQYDYGKATPSGFKRTGSLNAPPTILLNAVTALRAIHIRGRGTMMEHLSRLEQIGRFRRNRAGPDILFEATYSHERGQTCAGCNDGKQVIRQPRESGEEVVVHYGAIASGNQVIRDAVIRDKLSGELGEVLCFEMEAAGLMNNFPCLVIRGICDYADSHKNKRWQPYAAGSAAAYAKDLLTMLSPARPLDEDPNPLDDSFDTVAVAQGGDVEQTRANSGLSPSIQNSLAMFSRPQAIFSRLSVQSTSSEQECLRSLAFQEQEQRYHSVYTAYNTCTWLLHDERYLNWAKTSRGLLWIKGHPGTGKSVLMKFAILTLRDTRPTELIASYFVHGQGNDLQRSTLGVCRALLNSILEHYPEFLCQLTKDFENRNERYGDYNEGRWHWSVGELLHLLSRVLTVGTKRQPITIFIDALDECGEETARSLLNFFYEQTHSEATRARICVSSRHYPILGLDSIPALAMEENNASDIIWYTQDRLKSIQCSHKRREIEAEILDKAHGAFQWVYLATEAVITGNLNGSKLDKLQLDLASCPGTLTERYAAILNRVGGSELRQMVKLFEWILFSGRPLSAQELREALTTEPDVECASALKLRTHFSYSDTMSSFERHVKHLSRGLVVFQTREVWEIYDLKGEDWNREAQLIHQSVADFLLGNFLKRYYEGDRRVHSSLAGGGHYRISRSCLRYLTMDEPLNGAHLSRATLASRFPLAPYAVRYIFEHIRLAEEEGILQHDLLRVMEWAPKSERLPKLSRLWTTLDPGGAHTPIGWPFFAATALHVVAALGSKSAASQLDISTEDLARTDSDGNTALMIAIREGNHDLAQMLIHLASRQETRPHITSHSDGLQRVQGLASSSEAASRVLNTSNEDGDTALAIALDEQAIDVIIDLFEADPELDTKGQESGLVACAIATMDSRLLKILFVRHINLEGAVFFALFEKSKESEEALLNLVSTLLQAGADIRRSQSLNWTSTKLQTGSTRIDERDELLFDDDALIIATRRGYLSLVDLLISHGASVMTPNALGETSLAVAVRKGRLDIVQTLLRHTPAATVTNPKMTRQVLEAALHSGDPDIFHHLLQHRHVLDASQTPERLVSEISRRGKVGLMRVLLEKHNINPNLRDEKGRSSLWFAAANGHVELARALLAKSSVDINSVDHNQDSPLHKAAENGHAAAVKLLLDSGADPELIQKDHWTALTSAVHRGRLKVVKELIEHGVDVNAPGGDYSTALGAAAYHGHQDLVELLLDAGAEIDMSIKVYGTAFGAALFEGNQDTAELLLDRGADIHKEGGDYNNALGVAAFVGNKEMTALLLERGANIHVQGKYFASTLAAAAYGGNEDIALRLTEEGANVHREGGQYGSALGAAAYAGNPQIVQMLLEHGADLDVTSEAGDTPLHYASVNGHFEAVALLLKYNAAVDIRNATGGTALISATEKECLDIVELLLDHGAGWSFADDYGWTALITAAHTGNTKLVRLLLERGADMTVDNRGWTPLRAAIEKGHINATKVLLDARAPMTADFDHWTPLDVASGRGYIQIVELLLDHGAVPTPNTRGWTALHLACREGHLEIFRMLQKKGAEFLPTNTGWTPLHFAAEGGAEEIASLLLAAGLDVDAAASDEQTPLMAASRRAQASMVGWLIEMGANVSTSTKRGTTALHVAAQEGHLAIVQLLCEKGADIFATEGGKTPLCSATSNGNLEVARYLLDAGADLTHATPDKWRPLNFAVENHHLEIVQLFLDRGAYTAADGRDLRHVTIAHLFAFFGLTDFLRLIVDRYRANLTQTDAHDRTPLELAARSGNPATFHYLMNQGLKPSSGNADIYNLAASGGSIRIMTDLMERDPAMIARLISKKGTWNLLHWACRSGLLELVELLINRGFKSECIPCPESEDNWTPLAVAVFHGKGTLVDEMPDTLKLELDLGRSGPTSDGPTHGAICDGCLHVIHGPRFQCTVCKYFDYCFMCKPLWKHRHKGHKWKMFDSWDESKLYYLQTL